MIDWLLGMRLLESHRQLLRVNFRLDTVEAKTAALRDIIVVSSGAGILNGAFLLLDELEKQDGILSTTAIVRYLSALRGLIDALPNHLFMMLAITPDALRRYGVALPAFRSRLNDRITLQGLQDEDEALELAHFYVETARREGEAKHGVSSRRFATIFPGQRDQKDLQKLARGCGQGRRHWPAASIFPAQLHVQAEKRLQAAN